MSERPKISVVCPTYNCAKTMQATLDSLSAQTDHPDEIVFSDDGSDDDTGKFLTAWCSSMKGKLSASLRVLENNHRGPGAARNHGIGSSQGPWIAFMDSDDLWQPDKVKKVRAAIMATPDANFFLHWEQFRKLDGTVSLLSHGATFDPQKSTSRQLYRSNFCSTSAVVTKKDLLKKVGGFDPNFPSGQDYELWLRMSPFLKIHPISEVLGTYVERTGSITGRPYRQRYPWILRILWRHREKGNPLLMSQRMLRATLSRAWLGGY